MVQNKMPVDIQKEKGVFFYVQNNFMGDLVFVGLQPHKQNSLKTFKYHKLAPKFYGPFQLRKRSRQVSYCLDIPNKGKIHDEFHVPCLKKKLGSTTHIQIEFPMLDDEGKLVPEP